MGYIDRDNHMKLLIDEKRYTTRNAEEPFLKDIENIITEYKAVIDSRNAEFTSTWLLEKDIWIQSEKRELLEDRETLTRGRVVSVNPGVLRLGREQRLIHPYIVLAEHKETFIGVPITNMAYDKNNQKHYFRNDFEAELLPLSDSKKPFKEFRCKKPSIADIRNIGGLDKRRIIKNQLYSDKKVVPSEYLEAITAKIKEKLL